MSNRRPIFCVHTTPAGRRVVEALAAPQRPLSRNFRFVFFDRTDQGFWLAAPREDPVGCVIEVDSFGGEPLPAILRDVEAAAERLDAHGVSVFLLTTRPSVPTEWLQEPLFSNYHLIRLSSPDDLGALQESEETIIGHLHFARFATQSDVQVFVPSAIKFLRSRQRLEQECLVMSLAAESPARSRHFVKLLARHTCTDFHAIETERLDCTFADLLEVKGVSFAPDLPYYLIDKALEALAYLHDWSDVGIRTFGDFRAKTGLPLRQLIPASVYFRHFRPLAAETLDTLPFQVIHCDLKPSNFLVTIADSARAKLQAGRGEISPDELPEVKLFDFDLCRYSQPDPGSSGSENGPTFMGTCGYTAPELFLVASTGHGIDVRQERRITPLVDFYALGTLFFELLAREPLIPRDRLNVAEKDYYGTVLSYQRSADFAARLELAANPTDRAFIAACTKPVQGERDAALRRLLSIAGPGAPISANALKEWLRSERRTSP